MNGEVLSDTQQPIITSFGPLNGSIGTLVTVSGKNLLHSTSFYIGGVEAIIISSTETSLVGLVMPGTSTGVISIAGGGRIVPSVNKFRVLPTPYPLNQQGGELISNDSAGQCCQGSSVAVSADGNTAVVGGVGDNEGRGAAWIYARSNGAWVQQGSKLCGTGAVGFANQGGAVAIAADGNTVIVGGSTDHGYVGSNLVEVGAAWVFVRIDGVWSQEGSKLVGSSNLGASLQGTAVAISADGNTAFVGGRGDNNKVGAVWVYNRIGTTWTQNGNKLVGSGFSGSSQQGVSVAVSADGTTAIVGGLDDDSSAGAVWIFVLSEGTWLQQGDKLVGSGAVGGANQGSAVSISADGNTVVIGGGSDGGVNQLTGAAWVFTRDSKIWTQQGDKLVGTGVIFNSGFGTGVGLSADGNIAFIGGGGLSGYGGPYGNLPIGSAWVFARVEGVWNQIGNQLVGTGYTGNSQQGASVAISSDGTTAFVGGPADNSYNGGSWVFFSSGAQQGNKLVGAEIVNAAANQGYSVAISADGNTAVVGGRTAPHGDTEFVGGTWVFTRSGGIWTQFGNKLIGGGATGTPAEQGSSVAISADGKTIIVGGPADGAGIGAAWVFVLSDGIWTQQGPKLVGSGYSGAWIEQGHSVAISGDGNTAIVGGPQDNGGVGATWVFSRNGEVWTQQGLKLVGSDGIGWNVTQGISVAISKDGNTVIVGGQGDNDGIGATWVYKLSDGFWTQQGDKLVGTDSDNPMEQGYSVSISSDASTLIILSVNGDATPGILVFVCSGGIWTQQSKGIVGKDLLGGACLSGDGNTAIVSRKGTAGFVNGAWVFKRFNGVWTQQEDKLIGTNAIGESEQGTSLAISEDATTVIIGGPGDNERMGAAWIFTL